MLGSTNVREAALDNAKKADANSAAIAYAILALAEAMKKG